MLVFRTNRLDKAALDYLTRIEQTAGKGVSGVFVGGPEMIFSSRSRQLIVLALGLVLVMGTIVAFTLLDFQLLDPIVAGYFQTIALAIGVCATLKSSIALSREKFVSPLGQFSWADARYLWMVTPSVVRVVPIGQIQEITADHIHTYGSYSYTQLKLKTHAGSHNSTVENHLLADRLVTFLKLLRISYRQDVKKMMVEEYCSRRAAVAAEVARRGWSGTEQGIRVQEVVLQPLPPDPEEDSISRHASTAHLERTLPWAASAVIALVGFLFFPALNSYLSEERLYAVSLAAEPGNEAPFHAYLSTFPQGRYSAAVRIAHEENLYLRAKSSPIGEEGRYQRYLQVFPEGRYRDEVYTAYEDNLYHNASASPIGYEVGYQRYLQVFPEGRYRDEVRTAFEKNLFQFAVDSSLGQQQAFRLYLEAFPNHDRTEQVRVAYEDNLYEYAASENPEDYQSCESYLAVFPNGRFATEVMELRDNRNFTRALRIAQERNSPATLRAYRADRNNTRHLVQAQLEIDAIYDQVLVDLKERAKSERNVNVDEDLVILVNGLLEAVKGSESPIVTVGFRATHEDEPVDFLTRTTETVAYAGLVSQFPELKERELFDGAAILPRGEAFLEKQMTRRERELLNRLGDAIGKVFRPDLLKLELVDSGASPIIQVDYHVSSKGRLYLYSGGGADSNSVYGLIRGYEIDWVITTRPPGSVKTLDYRFNSKAAESMRMYPKVTDPDWAPYAVLMYSAFTDMSNRLILSFGLEPGPVPAEYSFAEATGSKPGFNNSRARSYQVR